MLPEGPLDNDQPLAVKTLLLGSKSQTIFPDIVIQHLLSTNCFVQLKYIGDQNTDLLMLTF